MAAWGGPPDPLAPWTSKFPLSPGAGPFTPSADPPSGPATRPFGMRFGVRPVELGKHDKHPTQKSRTKQTQITNDGQIVGYEPDIEYYVEMDEE